MNQKFKKVGLLDKINIPEDLREFNISDLDLICAELRDKTIEVVSKTGGHFGASLGVVELTVAVHYSFNTPRDKIFWDVGHQTYPHKIITGRKEKIYSLRKKNGLSGFTKIKESCYDSFGAGHSSTSISAAIGAAEAYKITGNSNKLIAVIGDGAISAGMAYEALNNAARAGGNLIIILNDNQMSISPSVGGMSKYLAKLILSRPFIKAKKITKNIFAFAPNKVKVFAKNISLASKKAISGNNFFEGMGIDYIGPVDGHDCKLLVELLDKIKRKNISDKPTLLHIVTEKGRGFNFQDPMKENFHGVSNFDTSTGVQFKVISTLPSFTEVFSTQLCALAEKDSKLVAITAAMASGTGLSKFSVLYPDRFFDVGIAEQHAVTFAGGLAISGAKPFVCIYSTFLQRAYDQIVHDIAIQNLPVRFAIDRAGYVGADGPTHSGSFDIAFLSSLPNFIVMAASSAQELADMVYTAYHYNDGPIAFRYPRGNSRDIVTREAKIIPIGKAELVMRGHSLAIIALGNRLEDAKLACVSLKSQGINVTLVNARFAKPVDSTMLLALSKDHDSFLTIEEGSIGGFAAQVKNTMDENNLFHMKLHSLFYPDQFLDQDTVDNMHHDSGMDVDAIEKKVKSILNIDALILNTAEA